MKTKVMLLKEDTKFQELHTFRPRIVSESSMNRPTSVFEKLYESKASIQSRREKMKYEKENQEFNAYSFKPNIGKQNDIKSKARNNLDGACNQYICKPHTSQNNPTKLKEQEYGTYGTQKYII